jgi:YhcH/YjgK/YiaL family protein
MILDKIENSKLYAGLGKRLAKAFEYINTTDLLKTETGKYDIDGDDVFAIVQEYDTKDVSACKIEAHRKYIDVQYVFYGVELMGISTLKDQQPVLVNEENDYCIYEGDSSLIKVEAGMFTIFFPDDLHMPGIKFNEVSTVKKVVVKVKI